MYHGPYKLFGLTLPGPPGLDTRASLLTVLSRYVFRSWAEALAASAVVALGGVTTGCAAEPSSTETSAPSTRAFLTVSRVYAAADDATPRTYVSARFLRTYDGTDPEAVASLLGAVASVPPLATCAPVDPGSTRSVALRTLSPVELVHAGDVTVQTSASSRLQLAARAYPDVARFVGGVMYTSDDGSDLAAVPSALTFHVTGSADVPPFDAAPMTIPDVLALQINGQPITEARRNLPHAPVTLRWPATSDAVLFEITPVGGATTVKWRCRGSEGGETQIPVAALSAPRVHLTVHRVRRVVFSHGLQTGQAQLETVVTEPLFFSDDPARGSWGDDQP